MIKTTKLFKLSSIVIILLLSSTAIAHAGTQDRIHHRAWLEAIKTSINATKYRFYTARILAVKNPEVYLKADLEMLRAIEALHPNIASKYRWNKLKKIDLITERERYGTKMPFFDFVDRRILPPTATLVKSGSKKAEISKKMTPLEVAILAYYNKKKKVPTKPLTILYCKNSDAYLISSDEAVSMRGMKTSSLEGVSCQPIMIFNEKDSWFPLMNKNATSSFIKDVVKHTTHQTGDSLQLSNAEEMIINKLKQITALTAKEIPTAILFAQRRGPIILDNYDYVVDESMLKRWQKVFHFNRQEESNIGRIHTGASHLIMQNMNRLAGKLSPVSAYIADTSECSDWIGWCLIGKYEKLFQWFLLWNWGLTSFSTDEAFASGGGGVCAEQSTYMASILDLMGIDYYALHLTGINKEGKKKDHRIIYVPKWEVTFSNNKMYKGYKEPNGYKGLVYLYHNGKWIFFANNIFFGNASQLSAKKMISNFIETAEKSNLTKELACKPFVNISDFNSCKELPLKNYHRISISDPISTMTVNQFIALNVQLALSQ